MNYPARPDALGRTFETHFDPRPARAFVGAGLFLFSLAGLGTILLARTPPYTPIAVSLILILHFLPALFPTKPAIQLRNDGFRLDGLGLIPWEAISRIGAREKIARRSKLATIEIELAADFGLAIVRPDDNPIWRKLQARNWRKVGNHRLVVLLSGLSDPPDDIRAAFEFFLGRTIPVERGIVA